ncbi:hypothetical protein PHACT_06970 [Pseudohongiella acticola]|jgi:uncharacterized protein (DUF1697 family)|uniref:DUF4168 domain-containing protein n=1 Tax=Pseudohongiella acticola TaxID=1524254 RepID=A0A1E8CKV1_9GAMM|nr:DUF4168 domain-containing protein [Pseudohongiella acticola]OFE12915.1 hypothetical protein PHACT_06970 [Pseudohongiella acticola]
MIKKLLGLHALFALIFTASVAHAQQAAPTEPAADVPQSAADIDADLKAKFVDAYGDIMSIQMRYAEQLQAVTDENQASTLQQQAQAEMQEAVTDNDISIQQYNQIIQLAAADEELMAELETAIAEEMES